MDWIKTELEQLLKSNLKDFDLGDEFEQRSVGDKIENECKEIAKQNFQGFKKPRSKKSLEDFSIYDNTHINWFDVKTHFVQSTDGFSMPNLVSVAKLKKSLDSINESIIYIFVSYKRENGKVLIQHIELKYVWELDWSILSIGNLGKGQLQIKNANKDLVFTDEGKEIWLSKLKNEVIKFYNKRIEKIKKEINHWK